MVISLFVAYIHPSASWSYLFLWIAVAYSRQLPTLPARREFCNDAFFQAQT